MRLARSVLENLEGSTDIFAIIAIIVAFIFFIGMMIWVIMLKKSNVETYSKLPLADEETDDLNDTGENHQ